MASNQFRFDLFNEPSGASSPKVAAAIDALASQGEIDARGAIFTRTEIVEFILDLTEYTEDQPLYVVTWDG